MLSNELTENKGKLTEQRKARTNHQKKNNESLSRLNTHFEKYKENNINEHIK